jgi:WD40 repeat protein
MKILITNESRRVLPEGGKTKRHLLNSWRRAIIAVLFLVLTGSIPMRAQDACVAPDLPAGRHAANIFSERQEEDLGDAMAEHVQRNYRVTTDEQLTGYIRQITYRLLKHMPPTQLHLKIYLVDLSDANAFNMAGGRVYVSPKIVTLARNEDELAGVLAHELGHLVVHQMAIDMTRDMAQFLKVTQVTDRRDIFEKYQQFVLAESRKPSALHQNPKDEDEDQRVADRLALYALAGSGYSLNAFADFFDRLAGIQGKSGSWLSDVLYGQNPNVKRLREMIKTTAAIPEPCIERAPKASADTFKTWQASVIDFSGWNGQEILHDVISKTRLNPPLQGEISHLKFSRDGKYILAQDAGNIYVLTRQPFAPVFQMEAPDAARAEFSPGSDQVVFANRHLRVEIWSIATHRRVSAHEIVDRKGCWQSNLSPDGSILACLEAGESVIGGADLVLFDTATGKEALRKGSFYPAATPEQAFARLFSILLGGFSTSFDAGYITAQFTPDSHYLLAGHGGGNLLVDLTTRQTVPIARALNKQLTGAFVFLATDRIAAVNGENSAKSHVLAFPSGETLSQVALGQVDLTGATRGDFVMLRPVQDYPVGAQDVGGTKHSFAYKHPALDIFDQEFVGEERDGELGIRQIGSANVLAHTLLPGGHLGRLQAGELSPDWKWLAVSDQGRGGVWNLGDGTRLRHIRSFQGAYFPSSYVLYADFPKYKKTPRQIAEVSLVADQYQAQSSLEDTDATQYGQFLVVRKSPEKSNGTSVRAHQTFEVRDVSTGATLWSRTFSKGEPTLTVDPREQRMMLWWTASSPEAKDEMQNFASVSDKLSGRKEKAEACFLEVVEARTGKVLGALAIDTGLDRFSGFDFFSRISLTPDLTPHVSGDWVAIAEDQNRVVTYSLSSGNQVGNYFGHHPVLSSSSGLMSLENESGHLTLYDLKSGEDLARWVFTSPISLREFSPDGKRLFVLTSDQVAYVLDVSPYLRASAISPLSTQAGAPAQPHN